MCELTPRTKERSQGGGIPASSGLCCSYFCQQQKAQGGNGALTPRFAHSYSITFLSLKLKLFVSVYDLKIWLSHRNEYYRGGGLIARANFILILRNEDFSGWTKKWTKNKLLIINNLFFV